jgi:hypothetical protein
MWATALGVGGVLAVVFFMLAAQKALLETAAFLARWRPACCLLGWHRDLRCVGTAMLDGEECFVYQCRCGAIIKERCDE